jgi:7-carboxy-7-deazaguanine synthase
MGKLVVTESRPDLKVYNSSEEVKQMSIFEIEQNILSCGDSHLVITGGEPLIQQSGLIPLLESLESKRQFFVEIETNGTITPKEPLRRLVSQWNVSPKLDSAGNGQYASEKPICIRTFRSLNCYFKFVIQNPSDLEDCDKFVEKYSLTKNRVLLMPEATEASLLEKRGSALLGECKSRGYRFSTRLRIVMFGNVRGK